MVSRGGPEQRPFPLGRKLSSAGTFFRYAARQKIGDRIGQAGTLFTGAPLFLTHEPDLPEDRLATYEGAWVVRDVNGRIFNRFTAEDKARDWASTKGVTLRDGSKIFTRDQKAAMAETPVEAQAAAATPAPSTATVGEPSITVRPRVEPVGAMSAQIKIANADIYIDKPSVVGDRRPIERGHRGVERRRPSARRLLT